MIGYHCVETRRIQVSHPHLAVDDHTTLRGSSVHLYLGSASHMYQVHQGGQTSQTLVNKSARLLSCIAYVLCSMSVCLKIRLGYSLQGIEECT